MDDLCNDLSNLSLEDEDMKELTILMCKTKLFDRNSITHYINRWNKLIEEQTLDSKTKKMEILTLMFLFKDKQELLDKKLKLTNDTKLLERKKKLNVYIEQLEKLYEKFEQQEKNEYQLYFKRKRVSKRKRISKRKMSFKRISKRKKLSKKF